MRNVTREMLRFAATYALLFYVAQFGIGCGQVESEGFTGDRGPAGVSGVNGVTGATGLAARPCTVKQNTLGALITCPDGSSAIILNGKSCHKKKGC